jgi:hypothetical protein
MLCPYLLGTSAGSILQKMDLWEGEVGLSRQEVKKMVRSAPGLFTLNLDDMLDKMDFLLKDLALPPQTVRKALVRAPALLFLSYLTLTSRAQFLRRDMGFSDPELARIMNLVPRILNYNFEGRATPLCVYLIKRPFRFSKEEVSRRGGGRAGACHHCHSMMTAWCWMENPLVYRWSCTRRQS